MNGNTTNVHHFNSPTSGKKEDWAYIHYFYAGAMTTNKISFADYDRIGISIMSNRTNKYTPFYTWLAIRDSNAVKLLGTDYIPEGNIIGSPLKIIDDSVDSDNATAGGIYYLDIPNDVDLGYIVLNCVNIDNYILAIWLE